MLNALPSDISHFAKMLHDVRGVMNISGYHIYCTYGYNTYPCGENISWWVRYTHLVSKYLLVGCTFSWICSISMSTSFDLYQGYRRSIYRLYPLKPRLRLPLLIRSLFLLSGDSPHYSIPSLSLGLPISLAFKPLNTSRASWPCWVFMVMGEILDSQRCRPGWIIM